MKHTAAAEITSGCRDADEEPLVEVRDPNDELVCLTVYRKGAREGVRRLAAGTGPG